MTFLFNSYTVRFTHFLFRTFRNPVKTFVELLSFFCENRLHGGMSMSSKVDKIEMKNFSETYTHRESSFLEATSESPLPGFFTRCITLVPLIELAGLLKDHRSIYRQHWYVSHAISPPCCSISTNGPALFLDAHVPHLSCHTFIPLIHCPLVRLLYVQPLSPFNPSPLSSLCPAT